MPPLTWTGHYVDGRCAAARRVTVEATADALVMTRGDGVSIRWAYDRIRRTQGTYDHEHVRLEHGTDPAAALVMDDQRFLTVLRERAPHLVPVLHDPARRALRAVLTILAGVIALVAAGLLYRWGIPGLARFALPYVPIAWERQIGEQVVEHLAPETGRCTEAYRTHLIQSLLTRLTMTVPENPYGAIRLLIVDEPMINAFAAPGGSIVVFRGLLEKTESPEQLAGVLAHELQHIYQRHTTRAILEQGSTSLLLAAVSGDLTGAATLALNSARTLGALQYSRTHEAEADAAGMKMLIAAGIDPQGMVEFFTIMSKDGNDDQGMLGYLSTHPSHADRIRTLARLVGNAVGRGRPLLPGLDWAYVRSICQVPHRPASDQPTADIRPRLSS